MAADGSVLVVEDDVELNELVGAYAQICGYEYRRALDGTEALRQAKERAPDAVVLDLMLPDIDGFEVCRRLKNQPSTAQVPVIILTALDGAKEREKGKAVGAIEYLTKPFDPDRLMQVISRHAGSPKESVNK